MSIRPEKKISELWDDAFRHTREHVREYHLNHAYLEGFQWMEQEAHELASLMGPEHVRMAATGGEAINDFFGNFPDLGWDRLVRTFLKTEKI